MRSQAVYLLEEKLPLVTCQLLGPDRTLLLSELEHCPLYLSSLLALLSASSLPKEQQEKVLQALQEVHPLASCPLALLPLLHSGAGKTRHLTEPTPSTTMAVKVGREEIWVLGSVQELTVELLHWGKLDGVGPVDNRPSTD